MIGIVLVTHGGFGEELLRTVEMIIGKQDRVDVIAMNQGSSLQDVAEKMEASIAKYEQDGVVVFTDMFGGSPSNVAMAYIGSTNIEVISGVNLPMLIRALTMRMDPSANVPEISMMCAATGRESIKVAGELLHKKV